MNKELKDQPTSESLPIGNANVVGSALEMETLAVIAKTTDGKIYQVALNNEMIDCLRIELKNYFRSGQIEIMPNEITGIDIGDNPEYKAGS